MVCDLLDKKFDEWYLRGVADSYFRSPFAEITTEAREMIGNHDNHRQITTIQEYTT
jgi:hypothetical protein